MWIVRLTDCGSEKEGLEWMHVGNKTEVARGHVYLSPLSRYLSSLSCWWLLTSYQTLAKNLHAPYLEVFIGAVNLVHSNYNLKQ